ncbi:MAG: amino acid adenylation domain-containing protein [Isosphaeraceae bacterium]
MNTVEQSVGLSLEQKRELVARLLRDRAGPYRDRPSLVHRRIEIQAERTPEAVALTGAGGPLTYAELNAYANRLARRLRDLGVGPEVLVGLCAGRSASMVVGLLAVLKAGGAYVPMDPTYPAERLGFMLSDARPAVILTEYRLSDGLPDCNAYVDWLDGEWPAIDADDATNLDGGVTAANLAYVIYTSGSTGRPKGVQVSHGALDNLLQSMRGLLSMSERDKLLAVTTLSFDIAALELFLPLIVGGQVELIDREVAADASRLAARLDDPRATFLQATPATWRSLLEAGWRGKPTLTMLCGGEALPRALADRLTDKGSALWNLYGPTETTVWSSAWRVETGHGPISIGRPIANTHLYVLDRRLRAVPVGVTGELYIGGVGLARGYWDRPGLTAERFIPDPFGTEPGGRLYRTGDLARWRTDGTLECLGRIDHQVKIRGFRVELGEVEAALAQHPEVRDVVVDALPDPSEEMRLAAYIVPRGGTHPKTATELRAWLQGQLPEYMIPSTFVTLDALPMTPNGKVDRRALPDPSPSRRTPSADFVPPRGPIEQAIAEIWSELLGGEPAGAHDNFFERGGHSLLAVQLLARLRHAFDVEASLKDFLEEPTVSRLARVVENAMSDGAALQATPIARARRDAPLPASFAQQRLWFLDQLDPGKAAYHIPAAVKLVGSLDTMALERALNEVVRRHEALRTTLVSVDGVPRQVVADSLELAMTVEDLSSLPVDEREAHALCRIREEAERPFDMARGPLVRAGLLRLGEQEHVAMVTMHHAISDGWSIGILIREVSALYEAFRLGEPPPFPELPVQYVDYAVWQRNWLQGPALEAQLDYWRNQLRSSPDLELPTDRPRPAVASHRGGERSAILPKSTLDALRALGRREGATLYVTLLAAFQVLLHRYSGQVDITVGSPIAGRARTELEGLIGFFVNTLVLRGDLSGNPGFRELLRRVRRTAMDAYAHQDVPFDKLVTLVHPDRNASRTPLFQVMFALQNAPMPALQTPGLLLTPLELPSRSSKFDLTLFAWEVAEGLRLTLEFRSDLFDAATADRMLAHYQILLEEIIAHPDRPIGALSMLTQEERNQLLVGWNDAAIDDFALNFDEPDDDAHALLYEFPSLEVATHE